VASLRASCEPGLGCKFACGSFGLISFSSRSGCSRTVVLGSEKGPPVGVESSGGGGSSVRCFPTSLATVEIRRVPHDAARRPERGKGAAGRPPPGSGEGRSPYSESWNKVADSDASSAVFLHAHCRLPQATAAARETHSGGLVRDARGPFKRPVTTTRSRREARNRFMVCTSSSTGRSRGRALPAKPGQESGERDRSDHADDATGYHGELGRERGGDRSGLEVTKSRATLDDSHLQ
jgi:hypothetical protein